MKKGSSSHGKARKNIRKKLGNARKEKDKLEGVVKELHKLIPEIAEGLREKNQEIERLTVRIAKLRETQGAPDPDEEGKGDQAMDRVDANLIFPEEVWRKIIGHVSDRSDLLALSSTCQLFEVIVGWPSSSSAWSLLQSLPHFYKEDLSEEHFQKLREICKAWQVAVDVFIEDHPANRPYTERSDPRMLQFVSPVAEKELSWWVPFDGRTVIPILEEPHFSRCLGQNPFMGRNVEIELNWDVLDSDEEDRDSDMDEYEQQVQQHQRQMLSGSASLEKFLRAFGKDIYYLAISVKIQCSRFHDAAVQKVRRLITADLPELLPNLRRLSYSIYNDFFDRDVADDNGIHIQALLPVAPLRHLEALEMEDYHINSFSPVGQSFFDEMIGLYSLQLRRLFVTEKFLWKASRVEWPALTDLHFHFILTPKELQLLENLRVPNLLKLGLNARMSLQGSPKPGHDENVEAILNLIRKLSSTTRLKTLRLEGYCSEYFGQQKRNQTKAPQNLKTLELELCWDNRGKEWTTAPSYNFLFYNFPTIQNINIFMRKNSTQCRYSMAQLPTDFGLCPDPTAECDQLRRGSKPGREKELDYLGVYKYLYKGDMYKSRIWEFLPKLKVFTFQWQIFTRAGYEEYRGKQKDAGQPT